MNEHVTNKTSESFLSLTYLWQNLHQLLIFRKNNFHKQMLLQRKRKEKEVNQLYLYGTVEIQNALHYIQKEIKDVNYI